MWVSDAVLWVSVAILLELFVVVKCEIVIQKGNKKLYFTLSYLMFFIYYLELISFLVFENVLQYITLPIALLLFLLGLFYNLPIILAIILLHKDSLRHKFQTTKLKYIAYGIMIVHVLYVAYTVIIEFGIF